MLFEDRNATQILANKTFSERQVQQAEMTHTMSIAKAGILQNHIQEHGLGIAVPDRTFPSRVDNSPQC
jgi:hypothetical protein